MFFKDRFDAAYQLTSALVQYASDPHVIILAIPRGGLELGFVLAKELGLPLDIVLSKKITLPGSPESAIGAVSETDFFVDDRFKQIPQLKEYIEHKVVKIRELLQKRNEVYRQGMAPLQLKDKTIIIVDDGVATGNTLLATIALIKQQQPHKIVVALPVAPPDTLAKIEQEVDELVCLQVPSNFISVGQWYRQFNQVDDARAIQLLHEAHR